MENFSVNHFPKHVRLSHRLCSLSFSLSLLSSHCLCLCSRLTVLTSATRATLSYSVSRTPPPQPPRVSHASRATSTSVTRATLSPSWSFSCTRRSPISMVPTDLPPICLFLNLRSIGFLAADLLVLNLLAAHLLLLVFFFSFCGVSGWVWVGYGVGLGGLRGGLRGCGWVLGWVSVGCEVGYGVAGWVTGLRGGFWGGLWGCGVGLGGLRGGWLAVGVIFGGFWWFWVWVFSVDLFYVAPNT
jgi:hypothetical protein